MCEIYGVAPPSANKNSNGVVVVVVVVNLWNALNAISLKRLVGDRPIASSIAGMLVGGVSPPCLVEEERKASVGARVRCAQISRATRNVLMAIHTWPSLGNSFGSQSNLQELSLFILSASCRLRKVNLLLLVAPTRTTKALLLVSSTRRILSKGWLRRASFRDECCGADRLRAFRTSNWLFLRSWLLARIDATRMRLGDWGPE
jgi:hypothetical protein